MWEYEKRLQFPVKIKNPAARAAKVIISQYGGPDGELGASLRYLSQRFAMPYNRVAGLLTDIGTEELAHLEMIGAIVNQLTRNLPPERRALTRTLWISPREFTRNRRGERPSAQWQLPLRATRSPI